jgi:hypothetical protein
MYRGYIKTWRKVLDSGWLKNHKLWVFWSWCLLKASYKEYDIMVGLQQVHLLPGQFIFGRKKASEETGLTEQEVRTAIDSLRKRQNITIKTTNKFSIVSIANWDIYQDDEVKNNQQINQPLTNKEPTTNQQLTTNNNNKNIKKEKNKYLDAVFLTKEEYQKLITKYTETKTIQAIEILNNYIMSKGVKYKSHYHTLIGWPMKEAGGNGNGIRTSRSDPGDRTLQSRTDAEVESIISKWETAKKKTSSDPGGDAPYNDKESSAGQ